MNWKKRWLISLILSTIFVYLSMLLGDGRPVLNTITPEMQEWYKECSQKPNCKIIMRNVKLLGSDQMWLSEPVLILRTSQVIDMSLMRFKGTNSNYLVLLLPDNQIDAAFAKLLGGR